MLHPRPSAVNDAQPTARPSAILATLAAIAIALAVCATAATIIVATDISRERGKAQSTEYLSPLTVAEARASLAAMGGLRAAVDSLVSTLAPFSPIDSVTLRRITNPWRPDQSRQALFVALPDSLRPSDPPVATLTVLNEQVDALYSDSARTTLVPVEVARDTSSSWLSVWRRFARSQQLPALWGFRDGLPAVRTPAVPVTRQTSGVIHLSRINELAGLLALYRGDAPAALSRGLENLAASRHFLDSPLMTDFLTGRALATGGARLSRAAATALGDSVLLAGLSAFDTLLGDDRASFLVLYRAAERDAADPEAPMAMELFDDEKIPFAMRVEILYAIVQGACGHTREVLFGFDRRREAQLRSLADRYASHATLGPILQQLPATARQAREAPVSMLKASQWPASGALDFLLPEGVAARAVGCQQGF